jgi:hypothetical protein
MDFILAVIYALYFAQSLIIQLVLKILIALILSPLLTMADIKISFTYSLSISTISFNSINWLVKSATCCSK